MLKRKIILPILVVLALTLTACTTDSEPEEPAVENPPIEEDSGEKEVENWKVEDFNNENDNGKVSPIDAFNIYIEKYPDSKVRKIELERNNNIYEYELEGFDDQNEYELKIDSETGDILDEDVDSIDSSHGYVEITKENIEKINNIVDQALQEAGEGAILSEWTLETEDGRTQIEVEIDRENQNDIENTYDIETGELLERDD